MARGSLRTASRENSIL